METDRRSLPVAVFDSGVGGISVLREAVKLLPQEDFRYFGDFVHAPYGTKTADEIRALTLGHVQRLYAEGIKAVLVACNTATSAAIGALRERYTDIPVVGIEPAVKPAVQIREHPRILVMATPFTVHGRKFEELLGHYIDSAEVIPVSCPGLMEFVERGCLQGPELHAHLEALLGPYLTRPADAVVLGCTHYPFVRAEIASIVGANVTILDGGPGTARELKRRLAAQDLLAERDRPGRVVFDTDDEEKKALCRLLLEAELPGD